MSGIREKWGDWQTENERLHVEIVAMRERAERAERERDKYHAYAAFLQQGTTTKADFTELRAGSPYGEAAGRDKPSQPL